MADYSACSISVTAEHRAAFLAIVTEVEGESWRRALEDSVYDDGEDVTYEVNEARYGFPQSEDSGDPTLWAIVTRLIAAGIPWTGSDDGGWMWPEAEYAWTPDLGAVKVRRLDGTGEPVVTAGQWARLLDEHTDPAQLVAVVGQAFGTDPAGWLD